MAKTGASNHRENHSNLSIQHGDHENQVEIVKQKSKNSNTAMNTMKSTFSSTNVTDAYLHQLSNQVTTAEDLKVDEDRLQRAVREAGEDAHGIGAVEVWLFNEVGRGRLIRPVGGGWFHSGYSGALRLHDVNHPEYVAADPVLPGVGVAGKLWAEAGSDRMGSSGERSGGEVRHSQLHWRSLIAILANPDVTKTPRMGIMVDAGFQEVTGVPFSVGGVEGMVIYFSGANSADHRMKTLPNEVYMMRSAELIGTVLATGIARRASIALDLQQSQQNAQQPQSKINKMDQTMQSSSSCSQRILLWLRKSQGANLQAPPPMTWREAVFTFAGCSSGIIIFLIFATYAPFVDDMGFHLRGPIGALMCLQYALPASPTTQPLPTILGQALSGAIGVAFAYLPHDTLGMWLRQILAPSLAITVMAKLGVTHPPAGATVIILAATAEPDWMLFVCVMIVSAATLVPAVFINNLSPRRQFPTYWGIIPEGIKVMFRGIRAR